MLDRIGGFLMVVLVVGGFVALLVAASREEIGADDYALMATWVRAFPLDMPTHVNACRTEESQRGSVITCGEFRTIEEKVRPLLQRHAAVDVTRALKGESPDEATLLLRETDELDD